MTDTSGPHAIASRHTADEADHTGQERLLRRAAVLHLDGDLVAAEAAYVELLEVDPRNAAVLNNLGLLRAQRGDLAGALEAYEAIGPDRDLSPTALLNKANAHLAQADPTAAVALLHRAVTLDPQSPAWIALGQAHLLTGDLAAAEAAFRQGYECLPLRVDLLQSYAACLAARGELGEAASLLATAVRLDDRDASSWRQLGAVLLSLRDLGSAAHSTRTALALEPDDVPTMRQMAVLLVALDRPAEAAEQLDRAITIERSTDLLVDRAVLHLAENDVASATTLLEEGAADDPAGRARLHLAYALLAAGRVDEARDHLERVSELEEPFATQAREALAQVGVG